MDEAPLAGRHVLVTGASRGIGAAAATALGEAGAAVTLVARNREAATSVSARIARAAAHAADIADYAAVARAIETAERQFGPIDTLVNNAGIIEPVARLRDGDPVEWARNIQVNLVGAYNLVRAVLPGMLARGEGRIVNLSSGAADRPLEGWSAYCAAKAGLSMLTRSIALEAGAAGIRVFGLKPGTCDTDMQAVIRASGLNPVSRIPRAALTPVEQPAQAIVYLCSGAADDLSGTEVPLTDPEFRRRIGLALA